MNDMMSTILKDEKGGECCLQLESILDEIVRKTKKIKNCIVYDKDGTLEENKINFNKIIQFVGDWTGYEVSCNEFRFERECISKYQFLILASKLNDMLSRKFNEKEIAVYILLYENEIELRFHIYRSDEGFWLDKDLNKYDIPILRWM